jgi:hypothetical protein
MREPGFANSRLISAAWVCAIALLALAGLFRFFNLPALVFETHANDQIVGLIYDGKIVRERFYWESGDIASIGLKLGLYMRKCNGTIALRLLDEANMELGSAGASLQDASDNSWFSIPLSAGIPEKSMITLEISTQGLSPDAGITFYKTDEATLKDASLTVEGESVAGILSMKLESRQSLLQRLRQTARYADTSRIRGGRLLAMASAALCLAIALAVVSITRFYK